MIKILHTIDTTGPGGAETVFVNLAKGLDSSNFKSYAAIKGLGWVYNECRKFRIEPFFLQSQGRFNFNYLLELIKIILNNKIDLIQSHLLGSNLYCSIAGMICRVPVVSTFHGFVDSTVSDRLMWLKSRIINWGSNKIVFVSNELRQHFIRRYGFLANKSVTIFNGVDTFVFRPKKNDKIRKELGIKSEHILIGAVGNFRSPKGYEYLLESALIVLKKYPECRFIIAGEKTGAYYEMIFNMRKALKLENKFFFIGFRHDVPELLNNLDIFVLPSVSEGFSISTIEALSCGLPVIATRSGGPEEIITDMQTGILISTKSPNEISSAISILLKNGRLKLKLLEKGKELVFNKFQIQTMVKSYEDFYYSLNL